MSKKLKPLTIFLSDDELVNFKSHFDEFLNMNCDDKIKEQQEEIERLNNIIKDLLDRQNEALRYIGNHLSLDSRYKHGNGNDELELVRRILNKHNQELKRSDKA